MQTLQINYNTVITLDFPVKIRKSTSYNFFVIYQISLPRQDVELISRTVKWC